MTDTDQQIFNAQWELVPDDTGTWIPDEDGDLTFKPGEAGWDEWWKYGGDFTDEGIDTISLWRKGDRWMVDFSNYNYGFNVLCANPGEAMRVINELRATFSLPVKSDEEEKRAEEDRELLSSIKNALWQIANDNDDFYRALCVGNGAFGTGLLGELKAAIEGLSGMSVEVSNMP